MPKYALFEDIQTTEALRKRESDEEAVELQRKGYDIISQLTSVDELLDLGMGTDTPVTRWIEEVIEFVERATGMDFETLSNIFDFWGGSPTPYEDKDKGD
jgi:hypothetical protein